MKTTDFLALGRRHGAIKRRWFRQRSFSRRHLTGPRPGLCAGLIQVWWHARLRGDDLLARLADPSPDLLREVERAQLASTYLEGISEQSVVTEEDRSLLRLKYGTADPGRIAAELRASGAADCLDFDLARQYRGRVVDRQDFDHLGGPVAERLSAAGHRPRLHLLILRYRRRRDGRSVTSGHRLAMMVPSAGQASPARVASEPVFFDPNCGEVTFVDPGQFGAWFEDFRGLAPYDRRLAASPSEDRSIRLYTLEATAAAVGEPSPALGKRGAACA